MKRSIALTTLALALTVTAAFAAATRNFKENYIFKGTTQFGASGTALSNVQASTVSFSSSTTKVVADTSVTASTIIVVTDTTNTGNTFKVAVTPGTGYTITAASSNSDTLNVIRFN